MADEPPEAQRRPGTTSRWNAGKDLSWVPVRVERVVEVTFGQLENGRFRHGVTFLRWRPDRTPESCRYDQLEVASPVDFREFMASSSA
jgi:ATP-dependent DNA ligase